MSGQLVTDPTQITTQTQRGKFTAELHMFKHTCAYPGAQQHREKVGDANKFLIASHRDAQSVTGEC